MRYCLVILFSLLSSWAFAQERWAIVVGISEYPTSSGWCNINGANDINIIVPMLQRNGFAPTHITTLANDQATKGNIKNAIIAIITIIKIYFGVGLFICGSFLLPILSCIITPPIYLILYRFLYK